LGPLFLLGILIWQEGERTDSNSTTTATYRNSNRCPS